MSNVIDIKTHQAKLEDRVIKESLAVASDMSLDVFDYETKDTDNTMIIFGLWVNLLVCLYLRGWTKENLIEELDTYQKIAKEMQDTA
jgi:hypothetical protein